MARWSGWGDEAPGRTTGTIWAERAESGFMPQGASVACETFEPRSLRTHTQPPVMGWHNMHGSDPHGTPRYLSISILFCPMKGRRGRTGWMSGKKGPGRLAEGTCLRCDASFHAVPGLWLISGRRFPRRPRGAVRGAPGDCEVLGLRAPQSVARPELGTAGVLQQRSMGADQVLLTDVSQRFGGVGTAKARIALRGPAPYEARGLRKDHDCERFPIHRQEDGRADDFCAKPIRHPTSALDLLRPRLRQRGLDHRPQFIRDETAATVCSARPCQQSSGPTVT